MFRVLVSDPISDFGLQQLTRAEDVKVAKITGLNEEGLISVIHSYDALLVRSQTKLTKRIIEAGVRLQVIGRQELGWTTLIWMLRQAEGLSWSMHPTAIRSRRASIPLR